MNRKSIFFIALAFSMMVLAGCGGVPAKIVKPGEVYSTKKYGICFDINDMKKMNRFCNVEVKGGR
jgi:uncharacterized protein YceK